MSSSAIWFRHDYHWGTSAFLDLGLGSCKAWAPPEAVPLLLLSMQGFRKPRC